MLLVLLLAGGALTRLAAAIPAFPGATGAGAVSVGGRGGDVFEVTSLADSGAGSLRFGIDNQKYSTAQNHARTIVFRVGGTIELKSPINITTPYLTIAGQTAPGGGIQLSGRIQKGRMVNIATHDVTIRYLRIRKGYLGHEIDETGAVLLAWNKTYNCIFDHLTLMWALDETACAWGSAPGSTAPHDITWSWSILAEPLSVHPTALLTGGGDWNTSQHMTNTDMHHCLTMNIGHRNPLVKSKSFRLVNNIFYNWGLYAAETCVEVQLDVIGNFFKKGPLNATAQPYEVQCVLNTLESDACLPDGSPDGYLTAPVYGWPTGAPYWSGSPSIFMSDNIGPNNPTGAATGQWNMVGEIWMNENQPPRGLLAAKYRRAAPLPDLTNPITAGPEFYKASQLPAKLLPVVGASQRLTADGTWISNRDTTELRLMTEYNNGTGKFPISENDVGGFPVITNGIPYLDSDHDGMPDDWENTHGLNANDPADHNNIGSSGYTRLEEFLNGDAANGLARPLSKPN